MPCYEKMVKSNSRSGNQATRELAKRFIEQQVTTISWHRRKGKNVHVILNYLLAEPLIVTVASIQNVHEILTRRRRSDRQFPCAYLSLFCSSDPNYGPRGRSIHDRFAARLGAPYHRVDVFSRLAIETEVSTCPRNNTPTCWRSGYVSVREKMAARTEQ